LLRNIIYNKEKCENKSPIHLDLSKVRLYLLFHSTGTKPKAGDPPARCQGLLGTRTAGVTDTNNHHLPPSFRILDPLPLGLTFSIQNDGILLFFYAVTYLSSVLHWNLVWIPWWHITEW